MTVFADLTKDQQLGFCNVMLQHYMEMRRLVQRHRSAVTDEERTAIQGSITTKVTEEPTVDSYLGE